MRVCMYVYAEIMHIIANLVKKFPDNSQDFQVFLFQISCKIRKFLDASL